MTRYRSEIGWPFVPVYTVLAWRLGSPLVRALVAGQPVPRGLLLAAAAVLGGLAYLAATTSYTITDDALVVRCGPFRSVVALRSIYKLRASGSLVASPALSLNRIEVLASPGPWGTSIQPAERNGDSSFQDISNAEVGTLVDRLFSNHRLATLYDLFYPRRPDLAFYFPFVMSARSVLDVGCGTGALLRAARRSGHTGRLCGLDPADAMLEQARRCADIEWILGDVASVPWEREFNLIVMTGHVFQVFIDDGELHASLEAIRSALTDDGRFVFETRNPVARAWEAWTPDHAVEIADGTGAVVRMAHQVDRPVAGDIVSFTTTYTSTAWKQPEVSRSRLRFMKAEALSRALASAGLLIEDQFGNWDRSPLTDTSPEIITTARRG